MGRAFPGGICDDAATLAYLSIGGELVAVDLTSGAVKWRRADDSEPLAASDRHLLTRRDTPSEPVLDLRSADSGDTIASLAAAQLPGFGSVSADDALDALIRDTTEGTEIRWVSAPRYLGGAMPRMGVRAAGGSVGAVLLDEAGAVTRSIAEAPAATPPPLEPVAAGAGTIAAARLGDSEFALRQEGGQIKLEERSPQGELRWSTIVGAAAPGRPGPLRQ